ncbi:hypothetical protein BP5796_03659 [Coleophoma crateriformis]|uniref:Sialidase domain-containing protein n=1 Tax=Coleophoma crateriformis TaxID=565419 RepID=A0A3D8SNR9_9HELO|nr:hypothetical protein BP5796_03659 [Coleophoma crateriformis]
MSKLHFRFLPVLLLLFCARLAFASPLLASHRNLRRAGNDPTVSGAAVSMNGGTYPRATRLADGSILAAHTVISGDENIISILRSTNNGDSWDDWGTVEQGIGDIDNPFLVQLPSGRVLCAFRNHSLDGTVYTVFRITICYSDDNGVTWAYLSQPASDPGPGPANGLWEPFMRISSISSNTLQLYYSRVNAEDDQDSLMRTSTDGGATWSLAATITGDGVTARDGMTGVAEFPALSGNLVIIFESKDTSAGGTGLFTVNSCTSSDDGVTWSTSRNRVYTPTGTSNNAGAPQIINIDGASFMTDEDTSENDWPHGADAKILTSTDGINWSEKTTVMPVQSYWPGLLALDDTSFLLMADHGGAQSQLVTLS